MESTLIDAELGALAAEVAPSTLRTWRYRGKLPVADYDGRKALFRLMDVYAAARGRAPL